MIDQIDLLNRIAALWWTWMSGMFWQVGLLVAIVACLDALMRRWAWPQVRYALWLMVMVKLVLPPDLYLASSMGSKVPQLALAMFRSSQTVPQSEGLVSFSIVEASTGQARGTNTPPAHLQADTLAMQALAPAISADARPEPSWVKPTWQSVAFGLWILGMLVLSAWLWVKLRSLRRDLPGQVTQDALPESFFPLVEQCAARLGLRRVPEVRLTRSILCPAVTGVFRPVLLVPVDFIRKLSSKSTEHMLLHEFAHIKRGDLYVHGVYMVLQIVYWFNPVLWLVSRQIHHLREICCDATVAKHLKERAMEYRQTLIEVAKRYLVRSAEPGMGLLGLFEDSNRLAARLNCLKRQTGRYSGLQATMAVFMVVTMMVCVLPMAQAQDEESGIEAGVTEPQKERVAHQMEDLAQQLRVLEQQRVQLQSQLAELEKQRRPASQSPDYRVRRRAFVDKQLEKAKQAAEAAEMAQLDALVPETPGTQDGAVRKANEKRDLLRLIARVQAIRESRTEESQDEASPGGKEQHENWQAWAQQMEQWGRQMEGYGKQVEAWTNSDQFKAFQRGIDDQAQAWSRQAERRMRQYRDGNEAASENEATVLPPLPATPETPLLPNLSLPAIPETPSLPNLSIEAPVLVPPSASSVFTARPQPAPQPRPVFRNFPTEVPISVLAPVVAVETPRAPEAPGLSRIETLVPPLSPPLAESAVIAWEKSKSAVGGSGRGQSLTRTQSSILSLEPDQVIHVTNSAGRINIAGGDGNGCLLSAMLTASSDDRAAAGALLSQIGVDITETGEGLFLTGREPQDPFHDGIEYRIDMNIVVPEGCKLIVQHGDGDIALANLNGKLIIRHEDGNIACKQISGDMEITLEDGNIHLDRIEGGSHVISLEDGNVRGEAMEASVDVRVQDGTVKLGYGPDVGIACSVHVTVEDGHIQLTAPSEMFPGNPQGVLPSVSQGEGSYYESLATRGNHRHVVKLKTDAGSVRVTVAQ